MKTKLLIHSIALLFFVTLQSAGAQSRVNKAALDVMARKEKREKQLAQARAKENEQRLQLQAEKKPDMSAAALPVNNRAQLNTATIATTGQPKETAGQPAGGN